MRRALATLLIVGALTSVAAVSATRISYVAATTKASHPTYALGHAKKCRVHYVKRTERHKVKGKERRYVACVYVAPKAAAATTGVPASSGSVASSTTTSQPVPSSSATTGSTSTTTTTIPAPQTEYTSIYLQSSMEDVTCGGAYCYQLTATLSDTGWPSPKNPPVNIGTITFSWSGAEPSLDGSSAVSVSWDGLGQVEATTTVGIPHGYTISATYSGGSYTDEYGGQIILRAATS